MLSCTSIYTPVPVVVLTPPPPPPASPAARSKPLSSFLATCLLDQLNSANLFFPPPPPNPRNTHPRPQTVLSFFFGRWPEQVHFWTSRSWRWWILPCRVSWALFCAGVTDSWRLTPAPWRQGTSGRKQFKVSARSHAEGRFTTRVTGHCHVWSAFERENPAEWAKTADAKSKHTKESKEKLRFWIRQNKTCAYVTPETWACFVLSN